MFNIGVLEGSIVKTFEFRFSLRTNHFENVRIEFDLGTTYCLRGKCDIKFVNVTINV
jgi:hypothetical protein